MPANTVRGYQHAISTLTRRLFGRRPARIERNPRGHAAAVYEVAVAGRSLIIKLHPNRLHAAWLGTVARIMDRARDAGIPVPRTLAHGSEGLPYAYQVHERVPGVPLDVYEGDPTPVWRRVGALVRRVNRLRAPGYGRRWPVRGDGPPWFPGWREYVDFEIERLTGEGWANGPRLESPLREAVRDRLLELRDWDFEPAVLHADISADNVIVEPASGRVRAIIDWNSMRFGPAPHGELATALLWIGPSERRAFRAGYGLSPERYAEIRRGVETLRLLHLTRCLLWHRLRGEGSMERLMRGRLEPLLAEPATRDR